MPGLGGRGWVVRQLMITLIFLLYGSDRTLPIHRHIASFFLSTCWSSRPPSLSGLSSRAWRPVGIGGVYSVVNTGTNWLGLQPVAFGWVSNMRLCPYHEALSIPWGFVNNIPWGFVHTIWCFVNTINQMGQLLSQSHQMGQLLPQNHQMSPRATISWGSCCPRATRIQ